MVVTRHGIHLLNFTSCEALEANEANNKTQQNQFVIKSPLYNVFQFVDFAYIRDE